MGPRGGQLKDLDPVNSQMRSLPTTVVSTTLEEPLDWPDATLVHADAVDVVARLKEESDVPLRSHGSLSMNRALMAAGHVDLELIERRTLDGQIQELIYRPTLH